LWRERFFVCSRDVRKLGFDERFQRMWDFYLGWCEGAFREHYIGAAQLVFSSRRCEMVFSVNTQCRVLLRCRHRILESYFAGSAALV
jgi:hypothetical protein